MNLEQNPQASRYLPPLWSSGLLISPQHFQALGRYTDSQFAQRSGAEWGQWGIESIHISEEALGEGTLLIQRLRAILPNGQMIQVPEECSVSPLEVHGLFPQGSEQPVIHLAIPTQRWLQGNLTTAGEGARGEPRRYGAERGLLCDENSGADEIPIEFRRLQAFLVPEHESLAGFDSVPLALCSER